MFIGLWIWNILWCIYTPFGSSFKRNCEIRSSVLDHPTVHSLVALSHNMLVMKSIDFHRLPFILLLLKSWMKMYWALWQCYSSLKAKKTLSSSVTLWANGLGSYTKAASLYWTLKEFATLIQNWFEMFSNNCLFDINSEYFCVHNGGTSFLSSRLPAAKFDWRST